MSKALRSGRVVKPKAPLPKPPVASDAIDLDEDPLQVVAPLTVPAQPSRTAPKMSMVVAPAATSPSTVALAMAGTANKMGLTSAGTRKASPNPIVPAPPNPVVVPPTPVNCVASGTSGSTPMTTSGNYNYTQLGSATYVYGYSMVTSVGNQAGQLTFTLTSNTLPPLVTVNTAQINSNKSQNLVAVVTNPSPTTLVISVNKIVNGVTSSFNISDITPLPMTFNVSVSY